MFLLRKRDTVKRQVPFKANESVNENEMGTSLLGVPWDVKVCN
jgi:hypothetical protein